MGVFSGYAKIIIVCELLAQTTLFVDNNIEVRSHFMNYLMHKHQETPNGLHLLFSNQYSKLTAAVVICLVVSVR